jgi:hypothetical protein
MTEGNGGVESAVEGFFAQAFCQSFVQMPAIAADVFLPVADEDFGHGGYLRAEIVSFELHAIMARTANRVIIWFSFSSIKSAFYLRLA